MQRGWYCWNSGRPRRPMTACCEGDAPGAARNRAVLRRPAFESCHGRHWPTRSTSGTGTCSAHMRPTKTKRTMENGSIITARSEQTNVACKRFPRCSHIPCTKRYVLKIPGCKVMEECKWCEPSLCYCTVRQQVLSTRGDDADVLAKLHSTLHTQRQTCLCILCK